MLSKTLAIVAQPDSRASTAACLQLQHQADNASQRFAVCPALCHSSLRTAQAYMNMHVQYLPIGYLPLMWWAHMLIDSQLTLGDPAHACN